MSDNVYYEFKGTVNPAPVSRVLIIGVNDNQNAAENFEFRLTMALKAAKVEAFSLRDVTDGKIPTKALAIETINRLNIDGVIVTRLIATQKNTKTTEQRSETVFEQPSPESLSNALVLNYKHTALETVVDTKATVLMSSDMYTTESENDNRTWGIQFILKDKETRASVLQDAVELIVDKMKRDGIVQ
jgi:hypothetical protein